LYDQIKNYFTIIKLKIILIRIQSYMMKLFFNIQFSRNNYTNAFARLYIHIFMCSMCFFMLKRSHMYWLRECWRQINTLSVQQ